MEYHYIISVSGKRILPADEPTRIGIDLTKALGIIKKISRESWGLTKVQTR